MEISVVIPAYNEAARLPPTLATVEKYLTEHYDSWEIVVSDDGSTDRTIEELSGQFAKVRFLRAPRNQGKGAAVRRGMLEAEGDLVLFSDADLSTPIDEVRGLTERMDSGGAQFAIASRGLPESRLEVRQPWWREVSGRVFNFIVRSISGLPYHDTQCGFKLFRKPAAQSIFSVARDNGWAFDVEILLIADMLGLKGVEAPVRWINSENSKVRILIDGPRMNIDILRFRWRRFTGAYAAAQQHAEQGK